MTSERKETLIRFIKNQCGLLNARRMLFFSVIGLVLCLTVLGILISVRISGAEGSDDIWVPMILVGVLSPVLILGVYAGQRGIVRMDRGELDQNLRGAPATVAEVVIHENARGLEPRLSVAFHTGGRFHLQCDQGIAEEIAGWLTPPKADRGVSC